MKEKKVPMRTCLGCSEEKPKRELIRIVKTPDGNFELDESGKMNGRGTYVCRKAECIEAVCKGQKLGRAFGEQPGREVYEMIRQKTESILSLNGGDTDGRAN